jgi:hypothetical protein
VLPSPLHVVVEPATGQDHAAPRLDSPLRTVLLDHCTRHCPVHIGDEFGHGRVQPERNTLLLHRQPEPGRKRLADRGHPVTEYSCPEHPPDQFHQDRLAAPVLADLVEEPKILGGEPDPFRCECQWLQQVLLLVAELAQVDRRHVDGAAEFGAAWQLRVVIGVAGLPDELEPRAEVLEELHHHWCGVDVLAQSGVADEAAGDVLQILEHAVGGGYVARFALARRTGNPNAAAG